MTSALFVGALALDVLLLAVVAVMVAIVAGYGGRFTIGPVAVSATSIRNPLIITLIAASARGVLSDPPFLGIRPLSLVRLRRHALSWWTRRHAKLACLTPDRALGIVLAVMVVSLIIKLTNAFAHDGFWTGDDVEIHEMTFAKLFSWRWQAWDLRSPFYPMCFIYPVQSLLFRAGLTDPHWLVFAGRTVVAIFSIGNLWLTFQIARRLLDSLPIATLSVLILAANKLHTMAGSTELPRTVSSFFVLAAFLSLLNGQSRKSGLLAGALVGVAAGMRFSELIFVVPAVIQLAASRCWRSLGLFSLSFAVVVAIIFGPLDQLLWPEPFFSLKHIVDFTLVKRLSSRGYQPFLAYFTSIPIWADLVTVGLAVAAIHYKRWILTLWTWLPVLILSLLPHKEPRYLIPILPFLSVMASVSLWSMMRWLGFGHTTTAGGVWRERAAAGFLAACAVALISEIADFRFVRTEKAVRLAQFIGAQERAGVIVAEQQWRLGGRLYLPSSKPIVDLDPTRIDDRRYVESSVDSPAVVWVAILDHDLRRFRYESLLEAAGFEEMWLPASVAESGYRLYSRRR